MPKNEQRKIYSGPNSWLALGLIALGVLLLLDNMRIIYFEDVWRFWPLLFIFIGALKLRSGTASDRTSGGLFIAIGVLCLLMTLGILDWDLIWPLLLIAAGLLLLMRHQTQKTGTDKVDSRNRIDAVAIFGGHERKVTSEAFEGGNVTTIFGGSEIDFEKAKLAAGENTLDIFALFGGTEIFVPADWHVEWKGIPVFGGFDDSRRHTPSADVEIDRRLVIRGLVLFGGFSVKSV